MYQYDDYDHKLVGERVEQFRRQVKRRMDGEITDVLSVTGILKLAAKD